MKSVIADKIMKKLNNKFLLSIYIVGIILYSCSNVTTDIYGNWAVLEVYYQGKDISGINRRAHVSASSTMSIFRAENVIVLPSNISQNEYGKFNTFSEGSKEYLKVYNATDERFNGVYKIKVKKISSKSNGKIEKFSVLLESDKIYIYGLKTETRF